MRFCPNCNRVMSRDPSSGSVVFQCPCGVNEPGGPIDARMGGEVFGSTDTAEMNRRNIKTAAFDRTNQLIRRNCLECGMDVMTQIRIGDAEIVILVCTCGATNSTSAAPPTV